ncbi:hypothetical protein HLB23_00640 [Nocardia uniformis]|uniref:Uncharacterized protein n=1 Tax=Nocardia uniformis TaxID=53432 RepID=A0A849BQQ1_9NOCA|nr:hypothetical protein [Nocardia uniformis]NNH68404.1 hypothetical protein [Nocardia uniformis]
MPSNDPFLVPSYDLHVRVGGPGSAETVTVTVADHHPLPIPTIGHHIESDWDGTVFVVTDVTHSFGARHRVRVYVEPVGDLPCDIAELPDWLQHATHIHPPS